MPTTTASPPTQLIIVCCHAIWLGPSTSEPHWLIQDFQRDETSTFIEHIKTGLRLLVEAGGSAVLVFSGGPTRPETPVSEGSSYLALARSQHFFNLLPRASYGSLIFAETRALDSFQNVDFPLRGFEQRYGRCADEVVVVSHAFKRKRFEEVHFPMLGEKVGGTRFVGVDPVYMVKEPQGERARGVREAEGREGLEVWRRDPKGVGREVVQKRERRNVWGVDLGVDGGWESAVDLEKG